MACKEEGMRYILLYCSLIKMNIIRELQFRTNLIVHFLTMFLNFMGNVAFYYFLYSNIGEISGWNKYEIYILVATINIINALFGGVFFFNLIQIPRKIKNYDLDYMILKPVNTVFYLSMKDFNVGLFSGIFFGIVLLIYSLFHLDYQIKFYTAFIYLILVVLGVLILYSILFFMVTFSLRFVRVNGLIQSFWAIVSIGENPYNIYPKVIKYVGIFLIPSIVIYNFPAIVFTKKYSFFLINRWSIVLIASLIAIVFVTISVKFFYKNLAYYYE